MFDNAFTTLQSNMDPDTEKTGFWVCEIPGKPLIVFRSFDSMKRHQNLWIDELNATAIEKKPLFDERFRESTHLTQEVFLSTERYYFAKAY